MMRIFLLFSTLAACATALVVPIPAANPASSLKGISLPLVTTGNNNSPETKDIINLGEALSKLKTENGRTMLVLGTHCADFNMVEYCQRVRSSWDRLRDEGKVERCIIVMNGQPSSCKKLAELLELPESIEICSDPSGEAGRSFGVSRGFKPEDSSLSPLLKVTVVGLGFGPPWMTLPAVLPGYFGNPNGKRDWIEENLRQGQLAGRWPSALDLSTDDDNEIIGNKFDDFPLIGESWGRRPFELATLRLQNLVGIQMKHWDELKPVDDRCLTQLGGCTVVGSGGEALYSWVDRGLCDHNYEELLR